MVRGHPVVAAQLPHMTNDEVIETLTRIVTTTIKRRGDLAFLHACQAGFFQAWV
jgi:hypothetical protein